MRRALAVAVTASLLVACGGSDEDAEALLHGRVDDVRAVLEGAPLEEIDALFAPSFLRAIPEDELRRVLEAVAAAGPFESQEVVDATATSATVDLVGAGSTFRMDVRVEAEPPHRITYLLLAPAPSDVASWGELDDRLVAAAPAVGFLAAEVVDGRCALIHAVEPDRVLPLASTFKLYVLGAAAAAVTAGAASWDDHVEDGVDLEAAATAMIEVSDNAATDVVIAHVGRGAVEAVLLDMGMAEPARNIPFPTTREMTLLKGLPASERAAYSAASAAERRRVLGSLPGDQPPRLLPSTPIAIHELEWFGSAADLCRAHAALHALGQPVRGILSRNPGVTPAVDRRRWPYLAFKGGSEPGVRAASWLGERSDGRTFFVGALLADERSDLRPAVLSDVEAAFQLLDDA